MRTTKLFATILVAGLIASACQQDPDYVLPAIKVESEELNFAAETEQTLAFTATRDWRVQDAPEWVTVVPDKGSGSQETQRVRVSVAPNTGYNRSGEFVLTIGLDKARVAVSQPGAKGEIPVGSGTKEDPYTVTGVLRYIATLGADVESPQDVYVKGKIATVTEAFSAQYGNGTFEMLSDSGEKFTFYRGLFLGNKKWTANDTQIKVDDEVVICGKVINFKGNTPETQQNKAYIYSLNGETQGSGGGGGNTGTPSGTGTQADPYNAAAANAYIQTLADNAKSDKDIYIKGKISKIAVSKNVEQYFTAEYGNASFYISDDGQTGGNDFYCYQVLYLGNVKWQEGNTQIKVGDEVIICGKVTKYVSSYGTTPETARNEAYIYSLNGTTEAGSGGQGSGGGGGQQQSGSIFSQAFKTDGQGSFTIEDKVSFPEGVTYVWSYDNRYGMKASAYANNANFASESWLVSPAIDLSSAKNPILTFRHALNYFTSIEKAKEEATVWAKPEGGEWAKLSGVIYPESLSWTFIDSGEIDLAAYVGKKIQIGFKYVSTADKAGTWEIDSFEIKEK